MRGDIYFCGIRNAHGESVIKSGDKMSVRTKDKVLRGYVTVESVDHATGVVKCVKPLPAGTIAGDELVPEEWHGLDRR